MLPPDLAPPRLISELVQLGVLLLPLKINKISYYLFPLIQVFSNTNYLVDILLLSYYQLIANLKKTLLILNYTHHEFIDKILII